MSKKLKILLYDIETEPNLGYCWGKWETNIVEFKEEWKMLSFAYKYLDNPTVKCVARPDFKDKTDGSVVKALWELLNDADIVISHNGDAFDQKMANVRFIELGLPPPAPYVTIDTKKVAKKYFRFLSNSLNDLGKNLGVGKKFKHQGFQMWLDCMAGDKKAWAEMIKYNKQDVLLLEKVYLKLRPWIENHHNVNAEFGTLSHCPKCGGGLKSCGIRRTKTSSYRNYRCLECKGYSKARTAEKTAKPEVI